MEARTGKYRYSTFTQQTGEFLPLNGIFVPACCRVSQWLSKSSLSCLPFPLNPTPLGFPWGTCHFSLYNLGKTLLHIRSRATATVFPALQNHSRTMYERESKAGKNACVVLCSCWCKLSWLDKTPGWGIFKSLESPHLKAGVRQEIGLVPPPSSRSL